MNFLTTASWMLGAVMAVKVGDALIDLAETKAKLNRELAAEAAERTLKSRLWRA